MLYKNPLIVRQFYLYIGKKADKQEKLHPDPVYRLLRCI